MKRITKINNMILLFLVLVFFTTLIAASQNQNIRELEKKLLTVQGKEKIEVLNELARSYMNLSTGKMLKYAEQALEMSRIFKYLREEAVALRFLGIGNQNLGNFETSLENAEKSLEIFERLGDKNGISGALNLFGSGYYYLGDYNKALEYFQDALRYAEEVENKAEVASISGNIGLLYRMLGNSEKDLEYQYKALGIREEIGDNRGIAVSLQNIGWTYIIQKNNTRALEYLLKSYEISKNLGNKKEISQSARYIGMIYATLKNYKKAAEYFSQALKLKKETGDKVGIMDLFIDIGTNYIKLKKYDEARKYLLEAMALAEESGTPEEIAYTSHYVGVLYTEIREYKKALTHLGKSLGIARDIDNKEIIKKSYNGYSQLYAKKRNYKKAFEFSKKYSEMLEKIYNEMLNNKVTEMQTKYETLKKEKEIDVLKKDKQIRELLMNRQVITRNVSIFISVLLLVIFLQFFRRYRYLFIFWKKKNYIGHYRLMDKIGSGGMGDIYKARNIRSKSHASLCAVKLLKEEYYKDEQYKRRFKNEAATIDRFHHPNIVRVMERGEYEGTLYIAMELLEGESLSDLLEREKQISLEIALTIMIQMACALVEIHKRGVIHRDLKPENIMIIRTEENPLLVKILDFGLARTQSLTRLTRTGMIMGTIYYVSPEQLSRSKILPAGDIYSLGVIFYQVLTGEKPFSGDTAFNIARQILKKEPVEIKTLQPGLPSELSALVKGMISKSPDRRPSSREVLNILQEIEKSL